MRLAAGQRVGPYEVVSALGAGGMAVVDAAGEATTVPEIVARGPRLSRNDRRLSSIEPHSEADVSMATVAH